MKLIDDFEHTIGRTVRTLSAQELLKLLQDKNIINKYFTSVNKSISLLDEIMKINTDQDVKCILYTIRESIEMRQAWNLTDKLFREFRHGEISKEELIEIIDEYKNSSNIILGLLTYECVLSVLVDVDLSKEQDQIKNLVEKSKDIFNILTTKIEVSYPMQATLADLVYTLDADNFERYGESLDLKWLDDIVWKFNEFQEKIFETDEFTKYQAGKLLPEDLGLIDITKLKEE